MDLVNEFRVAVPIDEAWRVLTDVERIAPCLPGATLTGVEGEEYHGTVKVKVGPITASYKGKATFQEKDDAAHRAVIKAEGKETRGQGNASALITAQLSEDAGGTLVALTTDLTISGKAAQFGRGVLADVSGKLIQQFARSLEADVLAGSTTAAPAADSAAAADAAPAVEAVPAVDAGSEAGGNTAGDTAANIVGDAAPSIAGSAAPSSPTARVPAPATTPAPAEGRTAEAEPVNMLAVVGVPLAKRLAPVVAAVATLLVVRRVRRGRRRG